MDTDFILQLIMYATPALLVAALSYLFFSKILEKQTQRDKFIINNLNKTEYNSKAAKMQAYERLIILAERTSLKNVLLRTTPISENGNDYQFLITQHIEQEFEYNVAQQLYVSDELWEIIMLTKTSLILFVQTIANQNPNMDAISLRSVLLQQSVNIINKTDIMLKAINEEAKHTLT